MAAPIEGGLVQIDAIGMVRLAAPHPFATDHIGAAEVLAEVCGRGAEVLLEDPREKVALRFGRLDRLLIEEVLVGGLGGEILSVVSFFWFRVSSFEF